MPSVVSSLPAQPAAAASAAVESAMTALEQRKLPTGAGEGAQPDTIAASASSTTLDSQSSSADADTSVRTVFSDPDNFNVKHPLFHRWTLWFDNPTATKSGAGAAGGKAGKDAWGEEMKKVSTIDSVEEFWGLYNNVIPPSELPQRANYYLFKEGIKPAWEDPANDQGGGWSVQLPRDKHRGKIDEMWLYMMLSAIGETLESPFTDQQKVDFASLPPPEVITGVIMSARPNFYRLSIWTRHADEHAGALDERLLDIGRHFKVDILGQPIDAKMGGGLQTDVEFQSHKESERKGRGRKHVV